MPYPKLPKNLAQEIQGINPQAEDNAVFAQHEQADENYLAARQATLTAIASISSPKKSVKPGKVSVSEDFAVALSQALSSKEAPVEVVAGAEVVAGIPEAPALPQSDSPSFRQRAMNGIRSLMSRSTTASADSSIPVAPALPEVPVSTVAVTSIPAAPALTVSFRDVLRGQQASTESVSIEQARSLLSSKFSK